MAAARAREFDLIGRYFKPLAPSVAARGLVDDAAVLEPADGYSTVVTVDTITEGVHFLPGTKPEDIARKTLRVNLSDIAAMGAKPLGYTLALALTEDINDAWLRAFTDGLRSDQETFDLTLLGGDTTSTPGPLSLSITMFGRVQIGDAVPRSGAQVGDAIMVTGTIGDSVLGLQLKNGQGPILEDRFSTALVERYQVPQPRLGVLAAMTGRVHAAADVSDGLIADVGHVADASGVRIQLEAAHVPLSDAARAALTGNAALFETILTGGDDYELVFAISPADVAFAEDWGRDAGVPVTWIGQVTDGIGVTIVDSAGRELTVAQTGYQHL